VSHAIGASRQPASPYLEERRGSGERESVLGSPRGEAPLMILNKRRDFELMGIGPDDIRLYRLTR
jgi:hypothetical protein